MSTKKTEQKTGLATASFILSLVGLFLALTVIGAVFGVPLAIVGLILGIVALSKKQKTWMSITGVVLGGLVTLITIAIVIFGTIFIKRNADVIMNPIMEMSQMMNDDPQLAEMMNNPAIQAEFEEIFKARLAEKYGEEFADSEQFKSWDDIKTQIPEIFDEMKILMLEMKEKYSEE